MNPSGERVHRDDGPTGDEEMVLIPFTYLAQQPGKGVRERVIDAFNEWIHVDAQSRDVIKAVVHDLHTASLLVDDVEDRSPLRRGAAAAHVRYGEAATINAANMIYFKALGALLALERRPSECATIYTSALIP